jgi:hypothetical protein
MSAAAPEIRTHSADMTSPVDLPPGGEDDRDGLIWTTSIIAIAALVLLLLNAAALKGWAYDLEPDARSERIVGLSEAWYQRVDAYYINAPLATMRGWWTSFVALEFGGIRENSGGDEAADQRPADADGPGFSIE